MKTIFDDGIFYNGDCLEIMQHITDNSVNAVICDLPYGTTACKWDSVIPFTELWEQYNRICSGNVVLFGSQPFTTTLISSNMKNFKYAWVWEKNFSTNFLHAKRMPLRKTEDICVFNKGTYNPQKTEGHPPTQSAKGSSKGKLWHGDNIRNYKGGDTTRYPVNIIKINAVDPKKRCHPTQKPVDLIKYLIYTYTNPGDVVLDNCAGSGTTAIACRQTGRKWICIEQDKDYYNHAVKRLMEIHK